MKSQNCTGWRKSSHDQRGAEREGARGREGGGGGDRERARVLTLTGKVDIITFGRKSTCVRSAKMGRVLASRGRASSLPGAYHQLRIKVGNYHRSSSTSASEVCSMIACRLLSHPLPHYRALMNEFPHAGQESPAHAQFRHGNRNSDPSTRRQAQCTRHAHVSSTGENSPGVDSRSRSTAPTCHRKRSCALILFADAGAGSSGSRRRTRILCGS